MKKKPQVLHLCPAGDFAWRFLCGFLTELSERGFETALVTAPGVYTDRIEALGKFPVHRVEFSRGINPFKDILSILKLGHLFRSVHPDILHAHTPKGGLVGLTASLLFSDARRIFTVHGFPYLGMQGWRAVCLKNADYFSLKMAHKVIAVSHDMKEIAICGLGCQPSKLTVPAGGSIDGVETENLFNPQRAGEQSRALRSELGIRPGDICIGFFGRLMKEKGLQELLNAWEGLKAGHPNLKLLIAGPVDERSPLEKQLIERLKQDTAACLKTGWIDHGQMPVWYGASDLVVAPSWREGLGMAILEAGAMEKPVVASDVPGCRCALKDGETGTLVPVRDSGALKDAVKHYVENAELRASHGRAARSFVIGNFGIRPVREAVISLYEEILDFRKKQF